MKFIQKLSFYHKSTTKEIAILASVKLSNLSAIIFFLLNFFVLNAQNNSILDTRVKGGYEEETLSFVLRDLNLRHDLDIKYNDDLLPNTRVTISFKDTRIRDVLNIILTNVNFDYVVNSYGKIVIAPSKIVSANQGEKRIQLADKMQTAFNSKPIIIGQSIEQDSKDIIVKGRIQDKDSYEPVSDALIMNQTTGAFTVSDSSGDFELILSKGEYVINISSLSHETTIYTIDVRSAGFWEIMANQKAHLIEEVVISGKGTEHNVRETISGLEILSKNEIQKLPTFMGEADVVKSLLSLSGVSSIGEGSSGYNVRGGNTDQNLILQDNAIVFNPSHVLGFFSSFNPDILKFSSLNKGHIPANYGGRVSSVLAVVLKEARMDQLSLSGSIGLISSKLTAEIPLVKEKTSLLLAGRQSYTKWLIKDIKDLDISRSQAKFNDLNAKLTHKISAHTKLNLSFFQSADRFQFSNEFGYAWKNRVASIQLKHIFHDRLSVSTDLAYSTLDNEQFEPTGSLAFSLTSGLSSINLKTQLLGNYGDHVLKVGIDAIRYTTDAEDVRALPESIIKERSVPKENGQEFAIYINDELSISKNLSINAGLRMSLFQQIGPATVNQYSESSNFESTNITSQTRIEAGNIQQYSGIEPRLSLRYSFSDNSSFKLSYNSINQYIHLISNTATPTPVDIWQVSNTHIKPLRMKGLTAGLFFSQEKGYDFSIEGYVKQLDNTLDYEDFSELLLNEHLETSVVKGEGRVYGVEWSANKTNGNLTGRMSYSYSRSEHRTPEGTAQVNFGQWFPSNFDQPHTAKLTLNWQATKRDQFSMNFIYNTGRPITGVSSNYLLQGIVVTNFSARNNFRLPDYHRLDLSYTFRLNRLKSARWQGDVNISLYNVYGRKNPFSIFYQQGLGSQVNALKLSVVGAPILSISYNFKW